MDYQGQSRAEQLYQYILVTAGILGFLIGITLQNIYYAVFTVAGGLVIAVLVTVPAWPAYSKNPAPWQPAVKPEDVTCVEPQKNNEETVELSTTEIEKRIKKGK